MSGLEPAAIATIIAAAATVGGTAYTLSKGGPGTPDLSALKQPPPPPPPIASTPPPAAPDTTIESEEQKARQRAALRIKDLSRRQSAPSTALAAPLGISAPAATGGLSTALGR